MTHYAYLVIGLILLFGLGIAWGAHAAPKEYLTATSVNSQVPEQPSPSYLAYTQYDNGTTARIHARDIITVRLPENPSTGYRWNFTSGGLITLDDTYIYSDPSGRTTGAGGVRFLTLKPEGAGTYHLTAVYKRPWEDDHGDESVFSMTFVVT